MEMDHKEIIDISEDEMLLCTEPGEMIYLDTQDKNDVLESLNEMTERAKELFEFTYQHLMTLEPPVAKSTNLRKKEFFATSSLLLRSLTEIGKKIRKVEIEEALAKAESEVEVRLYGRKLQTEINKEALNVGL